MADGISVNIGGWIERDGSDSELVADILHHFLDATGVPREVRKVIYDAQSGKTRIQVPPEYANA